MNTATFSVSDPGLYLNDNAVAASRSADPGDSSFVFVTQDPLQRGQLYQWRAGHLLTDLAGNRLEVDFSASFEVGDRPVADAGSGICSPGDSSVVRFDGSNSRDPDGVIARAIWDWGDGTRDTLEAPAGLLPSHAYPCADDHGCDELDNDGDGSVDEGGDAGCDESYSVIMTIIDNDGFTASDTTGLSFCAFRVHSSDPDSGAVGVDTLKTVTLTLTRACDPASADSLAVWLSGAGAPRVPVGLSLQDGDRVILLDPTLPLFPDTVYVIHAGAALRSATGGSLDQRPCSGGVQEYQADFRTIPRAGAPRRERRR